MKRVLPKRNPGTPSKEAIPILREMDIGTAVAANLKALRQQRGLTLSDLARRSGIAKGTLSKLEAGSSNPTLETLWTIADSLGVAIGELVAPVVGSSRIVRSGDSDWMPGEGLTARVIDRLIGRSMVDISEVQFTSGHRREAGPHAPGSLAHVFVLRGRLRTGPTSEELMTLSKGDYTTFPADRPHVYEGLTQRTAALVLNSFAQAPLAWDLRDAGRHFGLDGDGSAARNGA
jgi:transcriptional regulator with XRE-family HTH domain